LRSRSILAYRIFPSRVPARVPEKGKTASSDALEAGG